MIRTFFVLVAIAFALYAAYRCAGSRNGVSTIHGNERVMVAIGPDSAPPIERHPEEAVLLRAAAERAWTWVDGSYEVRSGLFRTVPDYPVATVWDVGSGLAALFSAFELGLLDRQAYDERVGRSLRALLEMPLFDGGAFNKRYATATGVMLDRDDAPSGTGIGWSATDLGRLLVWLRIIADRHPHHAAAAEGVVRRLDMDRIVRAGRLWGEDLDGRGRPRAFPEGFIGYEQYAARGFELWGHPAREALDLTANAEPLRLWDELVLVDRRPHSCLTSEPFVLAGLEFGWSPALSRLALAVLASQEARHRRTGELTIASEDASTVPPWHFYYYCVYGDGGPFTLAAPAGIPLREGPRTVSTKAAFGWYVLAPSRYTALAMGTVAEAMDSVDSLIAGLEESTGAPVGPPNINTAAVLLEAALYARWGRPFLEAVALDSGG